MSDLPEHVRMELPELKRFDSEIEELANRSRTLRFERQETINAEARKAAKHSVGEEFQKGKSRYRITSIQGDYFNDVGVLGKQLPVIWVRYRGQKLFKNGKVSSEETVYPD